MSDEQTAETDDQEAETAETGLKSGDFVKLAYTARTVDGGELVDTTDRETAEDEGVETEGRSFEPRTIVLGEGHLFAKVEEDIMGREVGESGTVTVPATEAFGEYEEEQVRTVSADKIPEDDRYPGAHVDVDGQHGHVETIIGGRARVDFNHPLAGKDVEYEYEIEDVVEDRVERASGLLSMYFDVDLEMHIETDEVEEEVVVEPDEEVEAAEGDDEEPEAAEDDDEEPEAAEGDEEETEAAEADESDEADEDVAEDVAEDEPAEPETEIQTVEKETLYIESDPQLQFNQQWMMSKQQILGDVIEKIDVDRVIVQEIIDGTPQMPGMGGMGMGGGGGLGDVEASLEDADIDADEIIEELGEGEGEDLDLDDLEE